MAAQAVALGWQGRSPGSPRKMAAGCAHLPPVFISYPFSLRQMPPRRRCSQFNFGDAAERKILFRNASPTDQTVAPAITAETQAMAIASDWAKGSTWTLLGLVPPPSPIFQIPQRPGSLGSDPKLGRATHLQAKGGLNHYSIKEPQG